MEAVLGLTSQIRYFLLTCMASLSYFSLAILKTRANNSMYTVAKFKFPASQLENVWRRRMLNTSCKNHFLFSTSPSTLPFFSVLFVKYVLNIISPIALNTFCEQEINNAGEEGKSLAINEKITHTKCS